ncbi:pilus assembly protein TadG-related protein [Mesorhizobium sp. M0571]|uniref:pilus assembly protein TadG-related protein n=1 Tax=Mesorhizobium sp. M0571 TaxID=2956960 RepID=UPI0033362D7A
MLRTIRAFWGDERGIAMILVAIMLPVIVGFALLVIDMSRANSLHNDLQKGADAFALATSAELDGKSDAIIRGDRALSTLVFNSYHFAQPLAGDPPGAKALAAAGVTRRYLRSIPADDSLPIAAGDVITDEVGDATDAKFVEVTVTPVGFATIFPATFVGSATNGFSVGAVSIAGFKSAVCHFTPVFMCNPYELAPGGVTLQQAAADPNLRRRLIELRKVGNGAAAGPGNFGFLEPPQGVGNGAQALAQTIATSNPIGCYGNNNVTSKTGQNAGPVQDAFNVRFGIKTTGGHFNTPEYGPAANVRKGAIKTQGSANQCPSFNQLTFNLPGTMGLPRDAGVTPNTNNRVGDGNWNLNTYWSTNFGTTSKPAAWATTKPTRYEVYRYEISAGLAGTASTGGEKGTPPSQCQSPITTVDRRLIYGAILNCKALTDAGNDLSGHSENLPVESFASFFLTEPVLSASDDASVMVELVDIAAGGQGTLDNFVRDEPQLYR